MELTDFHFDAMSGSLTLVLRDIDPALFAGVKERAAELAHIEHEPGAAEQDYSRSKRTLTQLRQELTEQEAALLVARNAVSGALVGHGSFDGLDDAEREVESRERSVALLRRRIEALERERNTLHARASQERQHAERTAKLAKLAELKARRAEVSQPLAVVLPHLPDALVAVAALRKLRAV